MKTLHDGRQDSQRLDLASDLAARIAELFATYPLLSGFSVQERARVADARTTIPLRERLCLAEVSVATLPGFRATQGFCRQIARVLIELLDLDPEARELLAGRTFARTFH